MTRVPLRDRFGKQIGTADIGDGQAVCRIVDAEVIADIERGMHAGASISVGYAVLDDRVPGVPAGTRWVPSSAQVLPPSGPEVMRRAVACWERRLERALIDDPLSQIVIRSRASFLNGRHGCYLADKPTR